ncbi:TPA: hypothetical protein ACGSTT_001962 [Vibrio parahaemolyticus]
MGIQYTGLVKGTPKFSTEFGDVIERDSEQNVTLSITVLRAEVVGEENITSTVEVAGDITGTFIVSFVGERSGENYVKQTYQHLLKTKFQGGSRI